jgi:hypothetical protein
MIGKTIFSQGGISFDWAEKSQFVDVCGKLMAWAKSAVADGWEETSRTGFTYFYKRDGFVVSLRIRNYEKSTRSTTGDGYYRANVHLCGWGPDKLPIDPLPEVYSWEALKARLTTCESCCVVSDVEFNQNSLTGPMMRLGFASRVCRKCHDENKAAR